MQLLMYEVVVLKNNFMHRTSIVDFLERNE